MSIPAYMTLELAEQGEISEGAGGEDSIGTLAEPTDNEDIENAIKVIAFNKIIHMPTTPGYGASGVRQHQGIKITKLFDSSSPLLYRALCTGEQINKMTINWYRIEEGAEFPEEPYYVHEIERAVVTRIDAVMPDSTNPASASLQPMEQVSFTYKAITETHAAGTEGIDDLDGEA